MSVKSAYETKMMLHKLKVKSNKIVVMPGYLGWRENHKREWKDSVADFVIYALFPTAAALPSVTCSGVKSADSGTPSRFGSKRNSEPGRKFVR